MDSSIGVKITFLGGCAQETAMTKHFDATLIIAASETDANLFYATRFLAPDPFIFTEIRGRKILLMNDLELDRARKEARVHEIIPASKIYRKLKRDNRPAAGASDLVDFLFRERRVRNVLVPAGFPIEHADHLRKKGYAVSFKPDPFYDERSIKTKTEIAAIAAAVRQTERALGRAIEALKKTKIKGRRLYLRGKLLTSERLKQIIHGALTESGLVALHTIAACGKQAIDPHRQGTGPLRAHEPIILDVFPRSARSHYYADMTRTVVRGKASPKLKKMYRAVRNAQEIAFSKIRDGADGKKIHDTILHYFDSLGFKTGELNGRMQGFFHGTGHGVGLDIHEPPRISSARGILRAGEVVTVEPGLYYLDSGGVRLEDIVVVTKTGCKNLNRFPKVLEI